MSERQDIRLIGYFELLHLSKNESRISDFPEYWNNSIYVICNNIYNIYFKLSEIDKKNYTSQIKVLKKYKLKFCESDVLGIKIMKTLHNYCFPLYKTRLLK